MIVPNSGPHVIKLRERIAELEEENAELRRLLSSGEAHRYRLALGLTSTESTLLDGLMRRQALTREQIMAVIYPDPNDRCDRSEKNIGVQIHNLNKKLKHRGIKAEVVWGEGYRISSDHKAKLKALMDRQFLKRAAE